MTKTFEQFVASDRLPSLPQVALRVIELARDPDKAMYEAKKNGGNQMRLYHILGEKQLSAAATECQA